MKGPVEVTLTKTAHAWWRDKDSVHDDDAGVLRIGRNLAVLDTTSSESDAATRRWLVEALADCRGRRARAPLVVVLVALRGHDIWLRGEPGFKPHDTTNPIRCIALCVGGSRVLVYRPDTQGCRVCRTNRGDGGRIKFVDNNMAQLRTFLDDNGDAIVEE